MTEAAQEQTPEQQAANAVADEAAFEDGFKQDSEQPTEAPAAATKATEPQTTTVTQEPENPWKGVPVVVRESLEGITNRLSALDRIDHRLKSTEGRVGAIQTALAAAKTATEQVGADAPTKQQVAAAAASTEKWKQLETDFPEWTMALNERLTAMSAELVGKIPKVDVDGIKTDVMNTVNPMFASVKSEARELARVDMKYEDWETTVKTKEFGDWFAKQTADLQALADSEKAVDAIKLLDAYKASNTPAPTQDPAKQKQQQRLAAAVTPTGTAKPSPPAISDDDAFVQGFLG